VLVEEGEPGVTRLDGVQGAGAGELSSTKVHALLGRRGVVVSYRTLRRYATTELGSVQRRTTVRVADCEPGAEVQVDFRRLGFLTDAIDGQRRVTQGLIFTAGQSWANRTGPKQAPWSHMNRGRPPEAGAQVRILPGTPRGHQPLRAGDLHERRVYRVAACLNRYHRGVHVARVDQHPTH